MVSLRQVGVGHSYDDIYFTTQHFGTNLIPQVEFRGPQLVRQLHLKIELLAVQGLDFDRDFLG